MPDILAWLRRLWTLPVLPASDPDESPNIGGQDASPLNPAHRLEILTAIIEHLEWCVMFNDRLAGHSLLPGQTDYLPSANDSKLGQWIDRATYQRAGRHPAFAELRVEHQRFHALAAQALELARSNRMDQASTLLNTDFERSRVRVIELLRSIQQD